MSTDKIQEQFHSEGQDEGELFITEDDVLAEIPDDKIQPMDDDNDDDEQDENENDSGSDAGGDVQEGSSGSMQDNSVQHFLNHKSSVFAVSCHPTEPIAASGGEDDLGYIWDITDGEVYVKLTGHTDSVTSVAWSFDGEMIGTGGMDGKIRIWRRVGNTDFKAWEFLTELQGPDEVMFLRWHPKGNVLLGGGNDGTLWLWQLPSGNNMQVFVGHTGAVNCGEFTPDGKRIVSACADGILLFWDPRSSTPIFKLTDEDGRFHLDGITSIGVNAASTLAVVGGASGGLRVISLSKGDVVSALGGHTEGESIEAVTFMDLSGTGPTVVVTGATDGKVCIWDMSTYRLRATLEHQDAITTLLAHPAPKSHLLVSASADMTLRTWDARNGTPVRVHRGHHAAILGASLGLGGNVIVSAGDDGLCAVYTTEEVNVDGIMQS